MEKYLYLLFDEIEQNDKHAKNNRKCIIQLIFTEIRRHLDSLSRNSATDPRKFHQHFEDFIILREEILSGNKIKSSVKDMARKCHLSVDRFIVLYKDYFSLTPYEELTRFRLNQAKKMLLTTSKSISEIGRECGWDNPYYFSRIFRKRFGKPPSAMRQSL